MAKVPLQRRVASNPKRGGTRKKGTSTAMTAAQKKAFVERMAKSRKGAKKNPSSKRKTPKSTGGKRNPHRHSKRRRNPDVKQFGKNVLSALLSMVATRQLPQVVLGANNTGWQGYLANGVVAAISAYIAKMVAGAEGAIAAGAAGGAIVLDRIATEQFSPIGNYLALTGLGDATAATSLGQISEGFWLHPTIYDTNGNPIIPHEVTDQAVQSFLNLQPSAAQPKGQPAMSGVQGRISGRFARR